jgi:hypothetical protein
MWKNNVQKFVSEAGSGFGIFWEFSPKKTGKFLWNSHLFVYMLILLGFARKNTFKTGKQGYLPVCSRVLFNWLQHRIFTA